MNFADAHPVKGCGNSCCGKGGKQGRNKSITPEPKPETAGWSTPTRWETKPDANSMMTSLLQKLAGSPQTPIAGSTPIPHPVSSPPMISSMIRRSMATAPIPYPNYGMGYVQQGGDRQPMGPGFSMQMQMVSMQMQMPYVQAQQQQQQQPEVREDPCCGAPACVHDRCDNPNPRKIQERIIDDLAQDSGDEVAGKKGARNRVRPSKDALREGDGTLMLRNIPNKYTQAQLLQDLKSVCDAADSIDFIYLPLDFKNNCNLGYAFLNFETTETAEGFQNTINGLSASKLPRFTQSSKILAVQRARVQGLEANIGRIRSSSVMRVLNESSRPLLFKNKEPIPFPEPLGELPPVAPRWERRRKGHWPRGDAAARAARTAQPK